MVHPDLGHVGKTYGYNGSSFTSSMIVNTPFIPHVRVKTVFLEAFKSYEDEEVLDLLFQQAEERGGDISYKLRKEVDLKHASTGVFVSKNGKFAEQGGVLGVDYFSHPSLKSAYNVKLMNHNWGSRPNKRGVTLQIIRENMDNHECFIPWSRGGWIAGKKEKGTMIKFSGHMYVHTLGHEGAVGCLFYPSEEI